MNNDLTTKSIIELAPLLEKRELSPVELTEAFLSQSNKYNNDINAYIEITSEKAMSAAKLAEEEIISGDYRGPLHGIPMALKDMFYFKGENVTVGSKIHKNFIPDYNATVVHKLKQAGVIFTGKLNMHEYALGSTTDNPHFGSCHNPWDLERTPGGSSGGSGAAVASDMSVASLGTDTAGSVRIPAAYCGVVGLKPTFGRISKHGLFPLNWSKDHIGPITKTVYDSALFLEILSGYDSKDPTSENAIIEKYTEKLSEDISGMVIGINTDYFFNRIDKDVEIITREAIQQLENMGARVENVKIPSLEHAEFSLQAINVAEASAIHHYNLISNSNDFGNDVRLMLEFGELLSAVDYIQAQQIRHKLTDEFARAFERVDVMISPTLPCLPPKIGEEFVDINGEKSSFLNESIRLTGPLNLTGSPAMNIPSGLVDNLPVGLQIIGPSFKEENILKIAYAFEKTNPLKDKKPKITSLKV